MRRASRVGRDFFGSASILPGLPAALSMGAARRALPWDGGFLNLSLLFLTSYLSSPVAALQQNLEASSAIQAPSLDNDAMVEQQPSNDDQPLHALECHSPTCLRSPKRKYPAPCPRYRHRHRCGCVSPGRGDHRMKCWRRWWAACRAALKLKTRLE